MPQDRSELDRSMQRILAKIQAENPSVKPVTMTPSTGNPLERIFLPRGAQAITNPFTGNIRYNPEALQGQSENDLSNTVTHELTHSKQAQETPWYRTALQAFLPQGEYSKRPYEMEAFQSERNRSLANNLSMSDPQTGATDIQLRRPRGVAPSANFLQGKR